MTNSPGYYSGYPGGYGDPGGAYGAYAQRDAPSRANRSRALWLAVSVLGLATFGVSFGSPTLLGWAVWFAVLAAVVAALELLPHQGKRGWLVVTFTVTGFLVGLSGWLQNTDAANWAVVVVVVMNLLQAIAAVAALLLEGDTSGEGADGETDYAAYAKYMQAYQAYAMQYQQGPPPQVNPAAQAQAQAPAQAQAQARSAPVARGQAADSAQASYESLQDRYAQPGGYPPAPQQQRSSAGAPSTAAGPDPGLPNYGRGVTPTQQPGQRQESSEEAQGDS